MNSAQPIRSKKELQNFKNYYVDKKPNPRNELLIVVGLNSALRISDILNLQWKDVYDFRNKKVLKHIRIEEQKTGKETTIYINCAMKIVLEEYMTFVDGKQKAYSGESYIFTSQKDRTLPMSRVQAFRIIKEAANACEIKENISCHSLRKTFGYHAWKQGTTPALLMNIYNHSSYQITKRYLGIEQDDRDKVFQDIVL